VGSLRPRLARLERIVRGIGEAAGRWVIIWPERDYDDSPATERVGANLSLRVPDGPGDWRGRLTPEQRALIGPADRTIVVRYVAAELPEGQVDAP
jgi:hypothetical protein